jgi:trehalose 6-phosphate phosphatase
VLLDDIQSYVVDSLHKSSVSVLMLDYDGTLAPFRVEREKAFPYPGVREVLDRIMECDQTRLVIISGRAISDLMPLLGLKTFPEIWGSHGWERRKADGSYSVLPVDRKHLEGLAEAELLIKSSDFGGSCETKPRSVALHWRGLPAEKKAAIDEFADRKMRPIATNYNLEIREFDGGLELRLPGRNKGDVVRSILADISGPGFCAYLGDDQTDEDAFEAVSDRGLGILVRADKKPTKARARLAPPGELIEFLQMWESSVKERR